MGDMNKKQLVPQEIVKGLPKIGETDGQKDPLLQVKFFYPDFDWTWYVMEFDGDDLFFGLVDGFEKELGYFSLSELMGNRGKLGLEIERDEFFISVPLSEKLPWWKEKLSDNATYHDED